MNFYQEITLIPDVDISPYFLWGKVYTQLHIALADVANKHGIKTIGVSFPNYRYQETEKRTFAFLGDKLRIFAPTKADLEHLNISKWLEKLTDHVHIQTIKPVPEQHGYLIVRRYRCRSLERTAMDFAKHKGIGIQEALEHCQKYKKTPKNFPFVVLKSQTTKQTHRLIIHQEQAKTAQRGEFNSYGINGMAGSLTVPHW